MIEYPFNIECECTFAEASLSDIKDPSQYPNIVKRVEEDKRLKNSLMREAVYGSLWKQHQKFRDDEIKKIKRKKLSKLKKQLNQKRCNCKKKNIPFDLDLEWYIEKLKDGCALTNLPFDLDNHGKKSGPYSPYQPSIDRIDPNGGYLKTNTRLILFSLNLFKLHFSDDHLYKISERLLEHRLKLY